MRTPSVTGWRDRAPRHQPYPLLAQVALLGAGYSVAVEAATAATLAIDV